MEESTFLKVGNTSQKGGGVGASEEQSCKEKTTVCVRPYLPCMSAVVAVIICIGHHFHLLMGTHASDRTFTVYYEYNMV